MTRILQTWAWVVLIVLAAPARGAAQASTTPETQATGAGKAAPAVERRIDALEAERRALQEEIAAARAASQAATNASAQALDARLADLERRVREIEASLAHVRAAAARTVAPGAQTPQDPRGLEPLDLTGQSGQVTSGTAFNPAISVIPDGVYYNDNRTGRAAAIGADADGFRPSGGVEKAAGGHGDDPERGFNLRELEVTFSGAVDPYFDVWAIVAVGGGEVSVEEAYVQTRKLLPGLQVRAGKFFSGVGYINRQHPHQWDFVDQALPHELLFGGGLNEVGVQANWLPSLPVYLQLGFEALQGENEQVSRHLGEDAPVLRDIAGPRLFTGFVKVAPDVGYSGALQLGFSVGHSRAHQEPVDTGSSTPEAGLEPPFLTGLDGTTTFIGADAVYKYGSGKQWGLGNLTLQGEYLRRAKSLDYVTARGVAPGLRRQFVQDGLYAQAVYGVAARWTIGGRVDLVGLTNQVDLPLERARPGRVDFAASRRYTVNVTFNPTEFSRLRLQYERGDFAMHGGRERYNQVWLQFQMSLGAHGAHKF
jgi:hypothetical protein